MIYGQTRIRQELLYLTNDINSGTNHNIMFRAQSGYGKTTLALTCAKILGGPNHCAYYIPENGEIADIDIQKRIHIIDEAHTIETPEVLYPIMDSGEFTFFVLTNEGGDIKEPFRNRCIQLIFAPYTIEELSNIVRDRLNTFNLPDNVNTRIAELSRGNPRYAVKLCERLGYVFRNLYKPSSLAEVNTILLTILNINEDGLNELDRAYLDYLNRAGGRASLASIIGGTGLDRSTIMRDIEPGLLYMRRIKITSRGRELC
jgi:Holliday junction resolvasome RuvABC ATP-dependent DNA helicase subunit